MIMLKIGLIVKENLEMANNNLKKELEGEANEVDDCVCIYLSSSHGIQDYASCR